MTEIDRVWFAANPERSYRCRYQTEIEDSEARGGPAFDLVIVRRSDGRAVEMWSSNPTLYTRARDKSLAFWFGHYSDDGIGVGAGS